MLYLFGAKKMQTSAKKACFQFAECSFSYAKLRLFLVTSKVLGKNVKEEAPPPKKNVQKWSLGFLCLYVKRLIYINNNAPLCGLFTIAYQTAVSRCSPYVPLRFSLIIPIASCSSTGSTCNPSSCTIHSKHGSFAVTRGTFVKHLTTFSSVFLPLVLL